ncbi:glycosyltransferase, partial [Lacticaseibacillus rhamnosus]
MLILTGAGEKSFVAGADISELAQKHRVGYLTRPGSEYKKAGNLRYAAERTDGEVIVIFDADFVPRSDFLVE